MTEKPILFTGPMVQAILDGRKTQTRRIIKSIHSTFSCKEFDEDGNALFERWLEANEKIQKVNIKCPYGQIGDHLWVREKFAVCDRLVLYATSGEVSTVTGWKPSIYMPRWASRITLEITGIRVERVQDISWSDARWEGVERESDSSGYLWYRNYQGDTQPMFKQNPVASFRSLWDSINSKRGYGWEVNPLVWVIEFKKVQS